MVVGVWGGTLWVTVEQDHAAWMCPAPRFSGVAKPAATRAAAPAKKAAPAKNPAAPVKKAAASKPVATPTKKTAIGKTAATKPVAKPARSSARPTAVPGGLLPVPSGLVG